MANVLVTDGEQRAALAVVRSLGRAGHRLTVCAATARSLAGASRYASRRLRTPDPLREPAAFAAEVGAFCRREACDVVIPVAEPAMLALLAAPPAGAAIPFPPFEAFRRVCDKAAVLEAAASVGIAAPAQQVLRSRCGLAALEPELEYPVVLKPARSVGEAGGARLKLGVGYAADAPALHGAVARLPDQAFPLLLQQRVVGPGIGVFLLRWQGRRVAAFAHRRIREKPPSGGVSVYRESVAADPSLVELSERLLERFDWQGVAMVEYKLDAATGRPYLMEINGRFWGSLQLAIDAGVDFPRLLVDCALGGAPDPVERYRLGVRSRWWWGDVDHLLARLRRSPESLALPAGEPPRWRVAWEVLRPWRRGDRAEVFRLGDPLPALLESVEWVRDAAGALARTPNPRAR